MSVNVSASFGIFKLKLNYRKAHGRIITKYHTDISLTRTEARTLHFTKVLASDGYRICETLNPYPDRFIDLSPARPEFQFAWG